CGRVGRRRDFSPKKPERPRIARLLGFLHFVSRILVPVDYRLAISALVIGLLAGCGDKKNSSSSASSGSDSGAAAGSASAARPKVDPAHLLLFQQIPVGVETPTIVDMTKLGQQLYFDTRISQGGKKACLTCHDFAKAGQDGLVSSNPEKKVRNTPTVINA